MTTPSAPAVSRALLLKAARSFYRKHSDLIKESHGIVHAETVYHHARKAIESVSAASSQSAATTTGRNSNSSRKGNRRPTRPPLTQDQALEIEAAALLHDVDDDKYFPNEAAAVATSGRSNSSSCTIETKDQRERLEHYVSLYPNAFELMREARIPESSHEIILFMIDAVSCSKNGNSVPTRVLDGIHKHDNSTTNNTTNNNNNNNNFHLLIPRWSDRIEAVGARGVWRCYQYNQEKKRPLDLPGITPRPRSASELWSFVVPERFEAYRLAADGTTEDPSMLGHYYDKLFHVACPPKEIVRNGYLEAKLEDSAKELVEVCLRYGQNGVVDEDYIRSFGTTKT